MSHRDTRTTPTLRMARGGATVAVAAFALLGTGCASKGFVTKSLAGEREKVQQQLAEMSGQIETSQSDISEHESHLGQHDTEIAGLDARADEISETAREALERANEAGKLAEGRFVSETVLATDALRFGFESAELSDEAAEVLAELASQLVEDDADVFIEIQGHTDSTGPAAYNETLGMQRAMAVRDHLYKEHRVPLHRMAVFSYGEEAELASNDSREGRAQNRRVSLIVLR